jgi:hypothetical protein
MYVRIYHIYDACYRDRFITEAMDKQAAAERDRRKKACAYIHIYIIYPNYSNYPNYPNYPSVFSGAGRRGRQEGSGDENYS